MVEENLWAGITLIYLIYIYNKKMGAGRLQNDSGDITLRKLCFYLVIAMLLEGKSYAFVLHGLF